MYIVMKHRLWAKSKQIINKRKRVSNREHVSKSMKLPSLKKGRSYSTHRIEQICGGVLVLLGLRGPMHAMSKASCDCGSTPTCLDMLLCEFLFFQPNQIISEMSCRLQNSNLSHSLALIQKFYRNRMQTVCTVGSHTCIHAVCELRKM